MINVETVYEEGFQAGRDSRDPEIESLKRRIAELTQERDFYMGESRGYSDMISDMSKRLDKILEH